MHLNRRFSTLLFIDAVPAFVRAQTNSVSKVTETVKPKVDCTAMAGKMIPASAFALPTGGVIIKSAKMDPGTGQLSIPGQVALPVDFVPPYCYIGGSH